MLLYNGFKMYNNLSSTNLPNETRKKKRLKNFNRALYMRSGEG